MAATRSEFAWRCLSSSQRRDLRGLWPEVTSLGAWKTLPRCDQRASSMASAPWRKHAAHLTLSQNGSCRPFGFSRSTKAVEQGHGSCAATHRWRPVMEGTMLTIKKAFFHAIAALFRVGQAERFLGKRSPLAKLGVEVDGFRVLI